MVKKCEIKFNNSQNGVFLSGQTLEGSVELVLEKPKKLRSFQLEIHGCAHASWSVSKSSGSGKNRRTRTVTYSGNENYIRTKTYLVNGVDGQEVVIPAGVHTYNFRCFLPIGTPTSFEGTNGYIRYTVKATLHRPWKFDQTSKVAFTVIRPVDLNYKNPSIRLPSQMEAITTFCCWPFQSAPLMLTARIPMVGYAAGQTIHISGELNNKSNVSVHAIHFSLTKTTTYYAEKPSYRVRSEVKPVVETETKVIVAEDTTKFNHRLVIPAVAPTNQTQSKVIHQTYELIVTARVSGCHKNLSVHIPILIGTVPLRQLPESPLPSDPEGQPFYFPTPAAPPLDENCQENTNFLELPPPSYQDCVMAGQVAIENSDENPISTNSFSPKYPVYNYGWL